MTYSIVGFDESSGALGVAVASHSVACGSRVPHVRGGVGAVATQALTEPAYGPRLLDGLAAGRDPGDLLQALTAADPASQHRQVAVIDRRGNWAGASGTRCLPEAAQHVAWHVSAQGNLLADKAVASAMIDAFEEPRDEGSSSHPAGLHGAAHAFALRLLAALNAAECTGGDLRGARSAALVVALPDGERIDARVDDTQRPLPHLARIVQRAVEQQQVGRAQRAALLGAPTSEAHAIASTLADITARPQRAERILWRAVLLARCGQDGQARRMVRALDDQPWRPLVDHLIQASLLPSRVSEDF